MTLRVLIVDDEPLARRGVAIRLASHSDTEVVGQCASAEEALVLASELRPDLIFLDIRMARMTGLEAALSLRKRNAAAIVFLTASRQFAVEAFTAEALDYLLKPIDDERFNACLAKARVYLSHRFETSREGAPAGFVQQLPSAKMPPPPQRIAVKEGRRIHLINQADINWIEGAGDYVNIHSRGRSYLLRETLITLEKQLEPEYFCRVHRSAIINLIKVREILSVRNQDFIVKLADGTAIRVSRTYSHRIHALSHNVILDG
jgi:two-component system LytT family response regulator